MIYKKSQHELKLKFTVETELENPSDEEILSAILTTVKGLHKNRDLMEYSLECGRVLDEYLAPTGMMIKTERDPRLIFSNNEQVNPPVERKPFSTKEQLQEAARQLIKSSIETGIWPVDSSKTHDDDEDDVLGPRAYLP